MSLFHKSSKKRSSREQIQIKEVKDNVLILPHGEYRVVIETSSVNIELKSSDEADILIDSFQNFLNSLQCNLQILMRTREIDVDSYLADIAKKQKMETNNIYIEQMKEYATFIQNLIVGNKILSRKFYIVIPYSRKKDTDKNHTDFSYIKEQLLLNQDIVIKGLQKLGMKARPLSSLEILDLFYSFYNPKKAKIQPITEKTMQVIQNSPYEFI